MQESALFPGTRQLSMYLIKDCPESSEVQTASVNKPEFVLLERRTPR